MIKEEILMNLKDEELDLLLNYLESDYIRKEIKNYVKELPDYSLFKFGGKRNSSFWKGFSKFEKVPYQKLKVIIASEFPKEERMQTIVLDSLRRKQLSDDKEELKKDILSNNDQKTATLLAKIYDIDLNIGYETYIEDQKRLKEEYVTNLEAETKRLSSHYEDIIEDIKNKNRDLNEKNNDLINELNNLQANILKKVVNDDKIVDRIINMLKDDNNGKLDNYINALLIDNQRLFANHEDFSELLILEYVLLRMRGNY